MIVWIIAIFLWMYMIPFLAIGLILLFPVFAFVIPVICIVGWVQYLLQLDTIRKVDFSWWFGQAPVVQIKSKSLICVHPHGVLCTASLVCIHFKNNTKFAVAPILIHMPIIGLFARTLGCIEATENAICNALKTNPVILCPGGIPELVTQKQYTRRHGFLRIAKKMNVHIITIVCKTKFYDIVQLPFKSWRLKIAKLGIPIMFPPLGWYGTWIPKPKKIKLEVFEPFYVKGDIEECRKKYYKRIQI